MDPRDFERAERRMIQGLPSPGSAPQELDPDTAERLARYIQNRRAMMDELALSELVVTPMGVERRHKPVAPALTVQN